MALQQLQVLGRGYAQFFLLPQAFLPQGKFRLQVEYRKRKFLLFLLLSLLLLLIHP